MQYIKSPALLLCLLITTGNAAFIRTPQSRTLPLANGTSNSSTLFYCQHTTAFVVTWLVNGEIAESPILAHTVQSPTGTLHVLSIPANSAYNNTRVVCLAILDGTMPSESTPPAVLLFQESGSPSPTGFQIMPTSLNITIGEEAMFDCQYCTAAQIVWILNTTRIQTNESDFTVHNLILESPSCSYKSSLRVANVVNYNHTNIQCEASDIDGRRMKTNKAVLLVQGPFGPVTNLIRYPNNNFDAILYTWEPPLSLDLTGIEPDIVYCITIFRNTCPVQRERNHIIDNCNVYEPRYALRGRFNLIDELYEVEVLPTVNLKAPLTLNGTEVTQYEEDFTFFNSTAVRYEMDITENEEVQLIVMLFMPDLLIHPTSIQPTNYSMKLTAIDFVDEQAYQCPLNVTFMSDSTNYINLTLICPQLKPRRLYYSKLVVPTEECNKPISDLMELSTHFVHNVTIATFMSPQSGYTAALISVKFINMSGITPKGFLAIAYSNDTGRRLHYGIALNADRAMLWLPNSDYRVSVFAIENESGLPFNRSVGIPKNIAAASPHSENADVMPNNTDSNTTVTVTADRDGCIHCTFLNDFASSCVAVIFERSQITSDSPYGLQEIKVFQFNRTGNVASGCLPATNTSNFTGAVFTFINGTINSAPIPLPDTTESDIDGGSNMLSLILGATFGVSAGFIIILVIIGIVTVLVKKVKHPKNTATIHRKKTSVAWMKRSSSPTSPEGDHATYNVIIR